MMMTVFWGLQSPFPGTRVEWLRETKPQRKGSNSFIHLGQERSAEQMTGLGVYRGPWGCPFPLLVLFIYLPWWLLDVSPRSVLCRQEAPISGNLPWLSWSACGPLRPRQKKRGAAATMPPRLLAHCMPLWVTRVRENSQGAPNKPGMEDPRTLSNALLVSELKSNRSLLCPCPRAFTPKECGLSPEAMHTPVAHPEAMHPHSCGTPSTSSAPLHLPLLGTAPGRSSGAEGRA